MLAFRETLIDILIFSKAHRCYRDRMQRDRNRYSETQQSVWILQCSYSERQESTFLFSAKRTDTRVLVFREIGIDILIPSKAHRYYSDQIDRVDIMIANHNILQWSYSKRQESTFLFSAKGTNTTVLVFSETAIGLSDSQIERTDTTMFVFWETGIGILIHLFYNNSKLKHQLICKSISSILMGSL